MTPGNFLALKTWKMLLKHEASTGAEPVFSVWWPPGVPEAGLPTLTKFILSLQRRLISLGLRTGCLKAWEMREMEELKQKKNRRNGTSGKCLLEFDRKVGKFKRVQLGKRLISERRT